MATKKPKGDIWGKSKQFVKSHPEVETYLVYTGKDGGWKTYISPKMQKRIIN